MPHTSQHCRPILFLLIALLAGCRTLPPIITDAGIRLPARESDTALRWPPPPARERIRYIGSFHGPHDLGIRTSLWRRMWGTITGNRSLTSFVKPFSIASEDNLLAVTDPGAAAVWLFDLEARVYRRWASPGKLPLMQPLCVAINNKTLYITDPAAHHMIALSSEGELLFTVGEPLSRPTGVCVYKDQIFVADSALHRLFVFDLAGVLIREIGTRGSDPGTFNFPSFMSASRNGMLVTDTMNHRVQRLSTTGVHLGSVGSIGQTSGHLSRPKGAAADAQGHIYVADALFDNVQIFNAQGQFLLAFGHSGNQSGEFWMPGGVALTEKDDILVADCYNMRIQLFRLMSALEAGEDPQ